MAQPFKLSSTVYTKRPPTVTALALVVVALVVQVASNEQPATVTLTPASPLSLTGGVDSNSPAVWDLVDGQRLFHVLTSIDGQPNIASGRFLLRLGQPTAVGWVSHPGHGVWMEAVVADEAGTWYGYYHNEVPATSCQRPDRALPRIGAARSDDYGQTWEDLGIILEAPPGWEACTTRNGYFVGGVGDFSVMLTEDKTDLYVFFSQYSLPPKAQGVAVARLLWADRDQPQGSISLWADGVWKPADTEPLDPDDPESDTRWVYPPGTALVTVRRPWHDSDSVNDAFWGPSVHWNTYLKQYVMLLNRADDDNWGQEGIYVSFASSLENPLEWSTPQRILEGGVWYPQIIGLEPGSGTDKIAGRRARLFVGGTSEHIIEFQRTDAR